MATFLSQEASPTIKNILLLDSEGKRVAVKYYSDDWPTNTAKLAFEKSIFTKTQKINARTEAEITMLENNIIVYKFVQDLHFFVTGGDDENELILATVLQGFFDAVTLLLRNNVDQREALENLDLILLCLDEIVDGGIVLETNGSIIAGKVATHNMDDGAPLSEQSCLPFLPSTSIDVTQCLHNISFDPFSPHSPKESDIADETYEDDLIKHVIEERGRHVRRGSVKGRITVPHSITTGHENLYRDYFADPPIFSEHLFRRRFRMRRHVFLRIQNTVFSCDSYFLQKRNAAGALGLSPYQKITAALRMLAYGVPADYVDEYVRIGESTTLKSLKRFVKAVVVMFGDEYLRPPNSNDIARLLSICEKCGFPGMLGSIDCMHWRWKNCPSAWKGSHNDINVLDRSSLFDDLAMGHAPPVNYLVNGNSYNMGYYLADGIYPTWATFVKTIPAPQGNKKKHFAKQQEGARKDVERAFGVLQARFAVVHGPARLWDQKTLKVIMTACIIMHNMIVEYERDDERYITNIGQDRDSEIDQIIENYDRVGESSNVIPSHEKTQTLMEFMHNHQRIKDGGTHSRLQGDLIEHLWQLYGGD